MSKESKKTGIVALIPARGGSKGIKRKNLEMIDSIPMVAHAILAALGVPEIESVWVSSDDKEILEVAEKYGALALLRPGKFAKDDSTSEAVITHFLTVVKCGTVVMIQPTSPMLTSGDLQRGIQKFRKEKLGSLFSACKTNDMLMWDEDAMYPINYDPRNRGRRQNRQRFMLIENGAFFIFSKGGFVRTACRLHGKIGYSEMPYWRSFQVDDKVDLVNIRTLMTMKG